MKFIERFLISMAVLGLVFRLVIPPYDPLIQLIGFGGLAIFYAIAGFFVVSQGASQKAFHSRGNSTHPILVATGILFGLLAAYVVLSLLFYSLGWTSTRDLLLHTFTTVSLGTIGAVVLFKHFQKCFYRRMLVRLLLFCLLLLLFIPVRAYLLPTPVLQYLNFLKH